jgi:hypothetical protein
MSGRVEVNVRRTRVAGRRNPRAHEVLLCRDSLPHAGSEWRRHESRSIARGPRDISLSGVLDISAFVHLLDR